MSNSWRRRGRLFDAAAQDYLEGRPGYPAAVFDLLQERCGLGPGANVLEVGAGAGQATLPMLGLGARVTAVEPGAGLAAALRRRVTGGALEVVVSTFEDARSLPGHYDLAVSATAFHWVDPSVGYRKCGQLLRPGGWLALWWTVWGDPDREDTLQERLVPLLAAKAPQLLEEGNAAGSYATDVDARIAEIDRTGLYGEVQHHVVNWVGQHDAAGLRGLFATFSPWLALPTTLRMELLDDLEELVRGEFDDYVERPYQTVMYLAQRR